MIITIWTGRFNGQKKKEKRLGAAIQKKEKKWTCTCGKKKRKESPWFPRVAPEDPQGRPGQVSNSTPLRNQVTLHEGDTASLRLEHHNKQAAHARHIGARS